MLLIVDSQRVLIHAFLLALKPLLFHHVIMKKAEVQVVKELGHPGLAISVYKTEFFGPHWCVSEGKRVHCGSVW